MVGADQGQYSGHRFGITTVLADEHMGLDSWYGLILGNVNSAP